MSERWIILAGVVLLAGLIAANVLLYRKRKQRKKVYKAELQQEKERRLDRMLQNPMEKEKEEEPLHLRPFEEKYTGMDGSPVVRKGIRAEILVRSESVQRKYLIQITRRITIGTNAENDLVLSSRLVPGKSCVLYPDNGKVWLERVNRRGEITLIRKRARVPIEDRAVHIHSKDRICIDDTELELILS